MTAGVRFLLGMAIALAVYVVALASHRLLHAAAWLEDVEIEDTCQECAQRKKEGRR